jgi:hypothetical protein
VTERKKSDDEESTRLRHQLAALEQLFEVYERTTHEEASRLEQLLEERKGGERRLAAQYDTALALAESATVLEAIPRILRTVCEALGWQYGGFWSVDRKAQVLRSIETWHVPDLEIQEFIRRTGESTFVSGQGLPGRVWATGQPAWISDVTQDPNFPRATLP